MLRKLLTVLRNKSKSLTREEKTGPKSKFTGRLDSDEQLIHNTFNKCGDIKYRSLTVPALGNRRALIVFIEGLVNPDVIHRDIVGMLMAPLPEGQKSPSNALELISAGEANWYTSMEEVEFRVMLGEILVLIDGSAEALLLDARQWPARTVEEPSQERTIHGPREGFTEVAQQNLGLIRRRLPTPSLKAEYMTVGERTRDTTVLVYLEDVADSGVVDEVRERINAINIDGILEPGALGELITERTISPFPLQITTERPDKVAGGLMQGKVGVVADGSPFVMLIPVIVSDFFQSPEDYYIHPLFATLGRVVRVVSFYLSTTLVATYVAILSFHYEMIPRDIIVFIGETRVGVPFSPFLEAILLESGIELIREASLRLPGAIGPTIGIVGALVLGQAAVEARLVSPVLLILAAVGLMANFSIPNYEASLALRYIRFPLIVAAGLY